MNNLIVVLALALAVTGCARGSYNREARKALEARMEIQSQNTRISHAIYTNDTSGLQKGDHQLYKQFKSNQESQQRQQQEIARKAKVENARQQKNIAEQQKKVANEQVDSAFRSFLRSKGEHRAAGIANVHRKVLNEFPPNKQISPEKQAAFQSSLSHTENLLFEEMYLTHAEDYRELLSEFGDNYREVLNAQAQQMASEQRKLYVEMMKNRPDPFAGMRDVNPELLLLPSQRPSSVTETRCRPDGIGGTVCETRSE